MIFRKRLLYPLLCGVLLSCLSLAASASPAGQYVALRLKNHCERTLTLATVQADASHYIGHVLELRGMVNCKVETESGLMISLALPDRSEPILEVPKAEAAPLRNEFTSHVRVLVKVADGSSGTVAALKVLAVADDSEVDVLDRQSSLRTQAESRRQALQEEANRRVGLASRGGYRRGPAAVSGDSLAQSQYYLPLLDAHVRNCFIPYFNFIAAHNTRLDSKMVGKITYNLLRFAWDVQVDPRLIVAMVIAESDFDPSSTSHAGAMGLGQLMPDEARRFGLTNPYDVEQNLSVAIRLLREQLDSFAVKANPDGTYSSEQIRLAMAAYNAGIGAVKKYGGVPPYRETQGYVRRVESLYRQLTSGDN